MTKCKQTGVSIGFNPKQDWCLCQAGACALVQRDIPSAPATPRPGRGYYEEDAPGYDEAS